MSSLRVCDLMHPCAAATVALNTTLREAAERILLTGLEVLPVVDTSGRLTGIIAEAALIRALMADTFRHGTVATIATRHVDYARSGAALQNVLPLFRLAGSTVIPAVDERNHPVGLLHRRDVIRFMLDDSAKFFESGTPAENPPAGPKFLKRRTSGEPER